MARLKKEQMQLVLLIGIWLVGGLIALYVWVLGPAMRNRSRSTGELDTLNENIQKAKLAMQGESKLRKEYDEAIAEIRRAMAQYIVPPDSPLSWVTEKVYAAARSVGVEVRGVTPVRMPDTAWDGLVKGGRFVRPYAVQLTLECSYAKLLDLVRAFETGNPYLCIAGINVTGQDLDPTRHQVTLQVEWPMWGRALGIELPEAEETPAKPGAEERG